MSVNGSFRKRLKQLHRLVNKALILWNLPKDATARLLNVSENTTYLVSSPEGHKSILRVHRENYHTRQSIECELAWIDALRREGVVKTPGYFLGCNGCPVQELQTENMNNPLFLVLFHYVSGETPKVDGTLENRFEELGSIAACCHNHSLKWNKPQPFERLAWNLESVFGAKPIWGNWYNAPSVTKEIQIILDKVVNEICHRLEIYGKSDDRYNLIHADMRLANLLVDGDETSLIDFDDCGYGWLMYDFAAAISFIENDPRVPKWKSAWLKGYRRFRTLSISDEVEIDTLVMLRRMALLAWVGSHKEAPEAQALAPNFAEITASLGRDWLFLKANQT